MAKLTKFTLSPSGELVYKSTGKLAPSDYSFRGSTVYGSNGRRIGSLSRKLTKKDAARIAKAERSRTRRTGRIPQRKTSTKPEGRPSQERPRRPSKTGRAAFIEYGAEGWDEEIGTTSFPESEQVVKEEFAQRVRAAALSVAPSSLRDKIMRLSTEALWQAYQEDAYIFEVYFEYHSPIDSPHKSNVSVWLYQFVNRIEQYMGVGI